MRSKRISVGSDLIGKTGCSTPQTISANCLNGAVDLIKKGKAYVCDLNEDEIREYRGTTVFTDDGKRETPPGKDSPYRNRSVEENLDLFERMRAGEFPNGSKTLRAKIDMAHPNLNMRDPVMYRIMRAEHYRTGNEWVIYPMYDWTHGAI